MNKKSFTAVAVVVVGLAAFGGWFWSSNYLLAENDITATGNIITQSPSGGAPAPAPAVPRAKIVWKKATPAEKKAAQASIVSQLEAFKKDDWAKAATFQSSALKNNFGSVQAFQQVIEQQYPQFADYRKVEFLEAQSSGPHVTIAVKLTGSDGVKLNAVYMMVKEKGAYRVAGVSGGTASPTEETPSNLI